MVFLDPLLQLALVCGQMIVDEEKRRSEHPEADRHGALGAYEVGRRVHEFAEQRIVLGHRDVPDEISPDEQREVQNAVGGLVQQHMRRSDGGL